MADTRRPAGRGRTRTSIALALLTGGILAGVVLWIGFHKVLDYTNRMDFCISCHEMHDTVYQEYIKTPHFSSASGVQATCADCHVPTQFWPKMVAK
ncbi:NapC/NirT family cytochrome c, partial [Tropicimonas sp.]|uniref:NapC/NirT family cytochrome c n=1 Tax=Tropicimonas sp. TaxID=2067044 RepID=UPI003A895674